jgi:hypothetical protein
VLLDLNTRWTQRFCRTLIIVLRNKHTTHVIFVHYTAHQATYISLITAGGIDLYSVELWLRYMDISDLCEHAKIPHRSSVSTYPLPHWTSCAYRSNTLSQLRTFLLRMPKMSSSCWPPMILLKFESNVPSYLRQLWNLSLLLRRGPWRFIIWLRGLGWLNMA